MFDPHNPTSKQVDELIEGYGDAFDLVPPKHDNPAYAHGYIVGLCDRMGITLEFQRQLIREQKSPDHKS